MRHTILALLAFFALGSAAHADWLELSPHAGYTTLSMGDFNKTNESLWGWEGIGHVDELNNGMVLGLDATTSHLTRLEWLNLGLRAEYLQSNEAINNSPYPNGNGSYNTDQASLSSLLIGAKTSAPINDRLSLGIGAWLGYGYAAFDQKVGDWGSPTFPGSVGTLSNGWFSGSGLVAQLEGNLAWQLGSRFKLSFIGGWRWADFASLQDGRGTPLYDNLQFWEFGIKKPVNVDYSGATAQGSVSMLF